MTAINISIIIKDKNRTLALIVLMQMCDLLSTHWSEMYAVSLLYLGLWNHRRTFVCLSVCLFVCYHDN